MLSSFQPQLKTHLVYVRLVWSHLHLFNWNQYSSSSNHHPHHCNIRYISVSSTSSLPPIPIRPPPRRVVVTGLGLCCPLGTGLWSIWNRLISGDSGVIQIDQNNYPAIDSLDLPSKVAAPVQCGSHSSELFDLQHYVPRSIQSTTSPFIHYALAASKIAIEDSGWKCMSLADRDATGVCIGSGIGSVEESWIQGKLLENGGRKAVSPYSITRLLVNLAAGQISILNGYHGPLHSVSTACTTGAHSIGDAYRWIERGDAEVMIAGGSEAPITPISMALFSRCRALSTHFNSAPTTASRPFSINRDGFVMGEGAGCVVLEELNHARQRGANIYCEIRGYGGSADAHHITAPSPNAHGACLAMSSAIQQAGLSTHHIDYINAHATSTVAGDSAENSAIKQVFKSDATQLSISSTKGAVGHMLGAAGAVEAIFTILAIHTQTVPPTLNLHNYDQTEFDLDYTPLTAKKRRIRAALTNSFGFGGTNASLVFAELV